MLCTPLLTKSIVALGALFSLATMPLTAQTATSTTPPVGYVRTDLLGQSDTFTAASLTRPPVYTGTVESASGVSITVTGSPNWSAAELTYVSGSQPNTYYVRIGAAPDGEENPFEGREFKIEANGGDTLLLTDPFDGDLAHIPVGTKVEVIPYWTLNTLFPAEDEGLSYVASASVLARKTELMLYKPYAGGINNSPQGTYYFNAGVWKKVGQSGNFGDAVIENGKPFLIRNNTDNQLSLNTRGRVSIIGKVALPVLSSTGKQDNFLSTGLPVPISLSEFISENTSLFTISPSVLSRRDELYVYLGGTSGKNNAPTKTYYLTSSGWRGIGMGATNVGDVLISPEDCFIIRKYENSQGSTVSTWKLAIPYEQ